MSNSTVNQIPPQSGGTTSLSNAEKGHTQHYASRAITPGGHPLDTSQPAFPVYHRRLANPAPLGLFAFALTTFVLSWFNTGIRGIRTPNLILSLAFGYGGLVQLLAGMWEFAAGNTFGATAFSSYGGFWLSFGLIYWPSSGILTASYATGELESALGLYLIAWAIFTFIMMFATLKSSISLFSVFFFLTITFVLLSAGEFSGNANVHKAGGGFGLVTALCAAYTGASGLYTSDTSVFRLPPGNLSSSRKAKPN